MRSYFYKDESGKTQKYVFCLRCNLTPYKQDQIGKDIIKVSDLSYLCKKCCDELGILKAFSQPQFEQSEDILDLEHKKILKKKSSKILELQSLDIEDSNTDLIDKKENPTSKNIFFTYVLKCNDNTSYVGITSDVEKAIKNHNWGSGSLYTKMRRPIVLVSSEKATSLEEAKKMKIKLQKEYKIIV
jgi:putative endonuclease